MKTIMDELKKFRKMGYEVPSKKLLKTPEQIEKIKESGKINIAVLDYVAENIKAGMSTDDIDLMVYHKTVELGGIPAPLGYEGFPRSVCVSLNNMVCHGIPDKNILLEDGDIVNVDVSTIYNGFYSDSSRMFMIGDVDPEAKRLVEVTKQCIEKGLEQVRPWTPIGNVGAAINEYAKKNGFSVVREVGGHGVGLEFHEEPFVSFVSEWNTGMIMTPGMMFTIEPMVNMGTDEIYVDANNGWTIYTEDDLPSAQWEVQLLVTKSGYEIIAR